MIAIRYHANCGPSTPHGRCEFIRCILNANTISRHRQYIHIYRPHNHILISEITLFGPLCENPKSSLIRSFLYRQSIYVILYLLLNVAYEKIIYININSNRILN